MAQTYDSFARDANGKILVTAGVADPLPVTQGALSSTTDSVTNHFARWTVVAPAELQNLSGNAISDAITVPAGANAIVVQMYGTYTHAANSYLSVYCSVDGTNYSKGGIGSTEHNYTFTASLSTGVCRTWQGLASTIKIQFVLGAASTITGGCIKYQFCTI